MSTQRIVKLIPPRISPEHIKEKVVCIRAHRERIFQVFEQRYNDKYIFHNYGHGGAGWTFLFGCVNESIKQLEQRLAENPSLKSKSICIIGAGCYGLLTAITLARKGYIVRIIAKDTDNIPSYKAAGFFFPRPRKMSTPQEISVFQSRGIESYSIYHQIAQSIHPFIKEGVTLLPGYFGPSIDPGFSPYIAEGLMPVPEKVTIDFGTGKTYAAMEYKTIFINSVIMMQELHSAVRELGITITRAEIATFGDISESIIFNCAGLGAKKLTGDERIIPVQGHLITLKDQPPMEHMQYMINAQVTMTTQRGTPRDEIIYYAPKDSGILGITFIRGQDSLTANHHEFERLLQRCEDYFGTPHK